MRVGTSRRAVRGLAALALASCCAGALVAAPADGSSPAPTAASLVAGNAAQAATATPDTVVPATDVTNGDAAPGDAAPADAVVGTPLSAAERAARAADLAAAASRSERIAVAQAPAPRRVTVRVDGRRRTAWTHAATVADVLKQLRVHVRPADIVSPALASRVSANRPITITRVVRHRLVTTARIDFDSTRVADPELLKGHEKLVAAGHPGSRTLLWTLTFHDGHLVTRSLVDSTVTTEPRAAVTAYGTKAPAPVMTTTSAPTGSNGYPTFGGLNWYALAHCESGNDQHSHDGPYHGLYQFLLDTWQSVGGSGDPADASIYEQTHRAWLLYQREGRHPWPVCGKYL